MLERLVHLYATRGKLLLAIGFVVTVAAAWCASGLRLDSDIERLLPESAPSVRGLEQLQKKYGIIGRVSVVLQGDDPKKLHEDAVAVAKSVEDIEGVDWVEYRRPVDFFRENRLLYIHYDDLKTASERVEKRLEWEKQRANPFFVPLKKEEPPKVDLSDIEAKYNDLDRDTYYCSDDGKLCAVFIFPRFSAGDLQKSRTLLGAVRARVSTELEAHRDSVTFGLAGRYAKRVEQQEALVKDLRLATFVALISLFFFLLIYFRGIKAPVLVFVPLVMGTIWAFAWAELVFGSLNVLTGFFGAVLLGLGIDYGIHIQSRFLEALQEEDDDPIQAMITTLGSAGRASMYAGLTTIVAFGSLMASSFRAFFEYGVIALGGMLLAILANVTILPCLLLLTAGTRFEPHSTMSVHLASRFDDASGDRLRPVRSLMIGAMVLLVLLAALGLRNTAFEYDFRNVQTTDLPSWRLDERVNDILDVSQLPVIVLAKNDAHAQRVAIELRRRKKEWPEGWTMDRVVTVTDLVPNRQADKLKLIRNIKDAFDDIPKSYLKKKPKLVDMQKEVDRVVAHGEIKRSDLPEQLLKPFRRRDDPNAAVVIGFPTIKQHDVRKMQQLAKLIRNLPGPRKGETIDGINDSLLLVDILDSVKRDSVTMLLITILGLIFTAVIAFRRWRRILLLLATISVAIFVATGLVGLFHIKFNFINIVVLPIWLGLGVDAAFHLMVRREESPGEINGFVATALAVGAAFITSMLGFGAMLVTSHKGLFSMGAIAVIGLGSILIVSLLVQAIMLLRNAEF